jgi:hypothetical protein
MVLAAALAAVLSLAVTASAQGGKLRCFADAPATCTLNSASSATLDTTQGSDAGVYFSNAKSTNGTPLAAVDFSFTYFCAVTTDQTSCVSGGAPRWSIPISTDGNSKTTEGYAFLDAPNCGDTGTVSTADKTCPVFFDSESFANWDDFAAAHPDYTISGDAPFVIADVATGGPIIISDVSVTKA